jgi:hypothetical protein
VLAVMNFCYLEIGKGMRVRTSLMRRELAGGSRAGSMMKLELRGGRGGVVEEEGRGCDGKSRVYRATKDACIRRERGMNTDGTHHDNMVR